jgi:hypothetical protein
LLFSPKAPPPVSGHRAIKSSLEVIAAIRRSHANKSKAFKEAATVFQDKKRRVGTETKFNESAATHIRNEGMIDPTTLQNRAATFSNFHTPANERNIAPFPSSSIIVKAAWRTVGPDDISTFSVWDPPDPTRHDCLTGCPRTIRVKLATSGQICNKPANDDEPYLSSCFYAVPDPNEAGYVLLLFGLHVITKETVDWTWSTFWWQPNADKGKFAEGRPDSKLGQGFWKNYVMDSTLSMETPLEAAASLTSPLPLQRCRTKPSSTAKICFNPFIERFLDPNGPVSNCMACHRMATYPALIPDARGAAQRGYLSSDDACFDKPAAVMKVDYIWALSPVPKQSQLGIFLSKLQSELKLNNVLTQK